MDFSGKIAFITGGASGLGLGMARAFVGAGMKVILADIEAEVLDKAVGELGDAARGILVDVSDRDAMYAAGDEAESYFGKIHVLVNNAGVGFGRPVIENRDEDWDWVMGVNLNGVINGLQVFLPKLLAHGEGGYIVNTASMAGQISTPLMSIYQTTKYAVVGLTECLAMEMEPNNIGVSVLCPGFVDTGIFKAERNRPDVFQHSGVDSTDNSLEEIIQMVEAVGGSFGRLANADKVGKLVLEAMQAGELYIFPHPEMKGAVEKRFQKISAAFDWAAKRVDVET